MYPRCGASLPGQKPAAPPIVPGGTIVELEKKKDAQIIESYGEVAVTAAADDPTVCLVEFSFAVAHGLNQIRLTVHLTV